MAQLKPFDWFNTLVALAMLAMLALLVGCKTTYHAQYTNPDTGATTVIDVGSYREFPGGIKIWYDRSTGSLTLEAGEVTNGGDVEAARDMILGILPYMKPMQGSGG